MKKFLTEFGWIALAIFIIAFLVLGSNKSMKTASQSVRDDAVTKIEAVSFSVTE
jgi:preprotein translocase subunit SecG